MKFSHAIPIEHNLTPGPLWPWKHNEEELKILEKSESDIFAAQMRQNPSIEGGGTFKRGWWQFYEVLPEYSWKAIFADTALKDGSHNDYTVFQCWAKYQNKIYLVDQFREKVKSIYLEKIFVDFWNKHNTSKVQPLRIAYVEDKVSGTTLIQQIQNRGGIPIQGIPRIKSKVERALNLSPWIKSGFVVLPLNSHWIYDYTKEFEDFSPLMTHRHDDQIDPTLDAIQEMLINTSFENVNNSNESRPLAPSLKSNNLW